jgi:hypothetical protein
LRPPQSPPPVMMPILFTARDLLDFRFDSVTPRPA